MPAFKKTAIVGIAALSVASYLAYAGFNVDLGRELRPGARTLAIDASKDVIALPMSEEQDTAFQPNGVDRITLEHNQTYSLRITGGKVYNYYHGRRELSDGQKKTNIPGVTVLYCASDGKEGMELRQVLVKQNEVITFTTPASGASWLMAFILDPFPQDQSKGSFTLQLSPEKKSVTATPDASLEKRLEKLEREMADLKKKIGHE